MAVPPFKPPALLGVIGWSSQSVRLSRSKATSTPATTALATITRSSSSSVCSQAGKVCRRSRIVSHTEIGKHGHYGGRSYSPRTAPSTSKPPGPTCAKVSAHGSCSKTEQLRLELTNALPELITAHPKAAVGRLSCVPEGAVYSAACLLILLSAIAVRDLSVAFSSLRLCSRTAAQSARPSCQPGYQRAVACHLIVFHGLGGRDERGIENVFVVDVSGHLFRFLKDACGLQGSRPPWPRCHAFRILSQRV